MGSSLIMAQNLSVTTTVCSDASSVRMTGPWWQWNLTAGPEASDNGDGTWTFNFNPAPTENMEYLLIVDDVMENLVGSNIASQNWSCTPVTDQVTFANRLWEIGSGDVSGIYYGTCEDCSTLVIYGCMNEAAANYNPLATQDDGSCILPITIPIDFEGQGYNFTDFDGGYSEIIQNPFSTGINTSANVVEHTKSGGQFWAGTYLSVDPIDFSFSSIIKMKVRTPQVGVPVEIKLEQSGGQSTISIVNSTLANEWEELSFDFSGQPSGVFDRIVIIFDKIVDQIGDGSEMSTYYFDDIVFETGPVSGCTDAEANNYNPSATIDDGSCTYGDVVLNITVNPCTDVDSVRLTGPFWGWSPVDGPEASKNPNGTWTFTFNPAPEADMEYLLIVDGVMEDLVATGAVSGDWSCTPVTDYFSYANRVWQVGSGDVTDVYFGSCTGCGNDFNLNESINESLIYPNPVADKFRLNTSVTNLFVYDLYGKLVKSENSPSDEIDISFLSDGVYMIRLVDENSQNSIIKILKK
jgi:hypothetical protein